MRGQHKRLVHPDAASLRLTSTSGSTGIPLRFFESELDRDLQHECHCRLYLLLDDKNARAVNLSDLTSDDDDAPRTRLTFNRDGETLVDHSFRMLSTRDPAQALADRIEREAPGMLEGYPSAIALVARTLSARGQSLSSVHTICPVGEHVDDAMRSELKQAFPNAAIYGRYGASELGALAWQCPLCDEFHFNADHFAVRVDDDGRLLISKKDPSGFQLIHYDIGDELRLTGFGACDVNLPTVEIVAGRRDDILHDAAGEPLPVMPFALGDIEELLQWQIIQHVDLSLEIRAIVARPDPALADELERRVRADLRDTDLPIRVSFSDSLESHKLKRVVSKRAPASAAPTRTAR